MKTMKVPSYKALAIAILKSDNLLLSCGYSNKKSDLENKLILLHRKNNSKQTELF